MMMLMGDQKMQCCDGCLRVRPTGESGWVQHGPVVVWCPECAPKPRIPPAA